MTSIHLYQKARTGRIKHFVLEAIGNQLISTWYTSNKDIEGKKQTVSDTINGLNIGKANQTTDEEQCLLEYYRKVKKLKKEGYLEFGEELKEVKDTIIDLRFPLPSEFRLCKPIKEKPDDALTGKYIVEQKLNGECLILHNTGSQRIVYSRTMIDITKIVTTIPDVKDKLDRLDDLTIVSGEIRAIDKDGIEDKGMLRAFTTDKTTVEKAQERLQERLSEGYSFSFYPHDIYFRQGTDLTKEPFLVRNAILEQMMPGRLLWQGLNEEMLRTARKLKWEGYILRKEDSIVEFTLNGKTSRIGSWKYKFKDPEDCFVWGLKKGSGKFQEIYHDFMLGQWKDGQLLDCGLAGPGTVTHQQLYDMTKDLYNKGYTEDLIILDPKYYFVVEVESDGRTKPNKKGQICFNIPTIIDFDRKDKTVKECLYVA